MLASRLPSGVPVSAAVASSVLTSSSEMNLGTDLPTRGEPRFSVGSSLMKPLALRYPKKDRTAATLRAVVVSRYLRLSRNSLMYALRRLMSTRRQTS